PPLGAGQQPRPAAHTHPHRRRRAPHRTARPTGPTARGTRSRGRRHRPAGPRERTSDPTRAGGHMTRQTIVIAGAGGFIGRRLVTRFREDGARIVTIGRGSDATYTWDDDLTA